MGVDDKNTKTPKRTSADAGAGPGSVPASPAKRRKPSEEARRSRKRLNALLHGITSNSPVIPGMEDPAAWERHRDAIVASIDPVGGLEEYFANRLASLLWRLNRIVRYEIATTMIALESTALEVTINKNYLAPGDGEIVVPEPAIVEEQREMRILPSDHHLERITKQERHFHRQALQTLHEIEALQARRKGQPVSLARVDFTGPPAA
ncbi:MAG: hypothetical protein WEB04_04540 [Dehalococcoidia bacterium]